MDKDQLVKHNFSFKLKSAALANKHKDVCAVAQEIFDAGIELEEIPLLPAMREMIENILLDSGWAPQPKDENNEHA